MLFEWMNRQGRGVPGPSSRPKAPSSDLMLVVKTVAMSSFKIFVPKSIRFRLG